MTKAQAMATLLAVAHAVLETVREAGKDGAPASSIHLALTSKGMSANACQQLLAGLVSAGRLRCSNHTYFAT